MAPLWKQVLRGKGLTWRGGEGKASMGERELGTGQTTWVSEAMGRAWRGNLNSSASLP